MTRDRREGGGVTVDRRGGGERDRQAGAWWCDGIPGSPPCLRAAARRRWVGAGWRDEEAAKRVARPEEARKDKL